MNTRRIMRPACLRALTAPHDLRFFVQRPVFARRCAQLRSVRTTKGRTKARKEALQRDSARPPPPAPSGASARAASVQSRGAGRRHDGRRKREGGGRTGLLDVVAQHEDREARVRVQAELDHSLRDGGRHLCSWLRVRASGGSASSGQATAGGKARPPAALLALRFSSRPLAPPLQLRCAAHHACCAHSPKIHERIMWRANAVSGGAGRGLRRTRRER